MMVKETYVPTVHFKYFADASAWSQQKGKHSNVATQAPFITPLPSTYPNYVELEYLSLQYNFHEPN